jgi:hypothetical protein
MTTCSEIFISPNGATANIEVTGVVIPATVESGKEFDIRVEYTNTGGSGGTFIVHITIGAVSWDSELISLNPTTSQFITYTATAPATLGALSVCAVASSVSGGTGGVNTICQTTQVVSADITCDDADILCKLEYWVIHNPSEAFLIALLAAAGVTTAYYMSKKGKSIPGRSSGKSQAEYTAKLKSRGYIPKKA